MTTQQTPYIRRPSQRWKARLSVKGLPIVLLRWIVTGTGIGIVGFWLLVEGLLVKTRIRKKDIRTTIIKRFFEFMGGAWIKLGQQLAIRIDFIPDDLANEFSSLLDEVPPFAYKKARAIFYSDLGSYPEELFDDFSTTPIASASFGQVYAGKIAGKKAAIKVQRPGLKTRVVADTLQMKMLAYVFDSTGLLGAIRFRPLIAEITSMLEEEADYEWEKANINDAMNASRNYHVLKVPVLYPVYSSGRIITMEFLEGIWVNEILDALRQQQQEQLDQWESEGMNFKLIARRIFDIGMRQIFEVHKFNADPHAGNIVIMDKNVIGYVDYGLIGSIGKSMLNKQRQYFHAIFNGNADAAASIMARLVIIPKGGDDKVGDFRQEVSMQIQSWLSNASSSEVPLAYKSTARLLVDNIALIRKYRFSLPNNLARYYRALITSDIIILQLDKEFDFSSNLRRYFTNRLVRDTRKEAKKHPLPGLWLEYFQLFLRGPEAIRQFIQQSEEGGELIHASETRMKRWLGTLEFFSMTGLLIVLGARVLGIENVGSLIGFPVALDWRWSSIALYIFWRSFRAAGS